MSKFEYTDEMVAEMHEAAGSGVTEDVIETLMEDFGFPRRSVTAKLRKLGFDVQLRYFLLMKPQNCQSS